MSDPTVRGFEVYYHGSETVTNNDYNGYELAHIVHDSIVREVSWSSFSIVDRGVKADTLIYSSGFYVLRNTNMSAILIETLFISNNDDALLLTNEDFQWAVARGILRGLYRYFSVGRKMYSNIKGADSDYPAAWLLSNGTIAYVWHTNVTGTYTIMFTLTDMDGNVLSQKMLTGTASYHPAIVESSDGKIFVFYNRPSGTYHDIYYLIYDPTSGWSSEYLLSSSSTGYTSFPHAIRVGNRIIVFFHSNRDGDWDIYMKYSDDNGATWSNDIKIFDTTTNERAPRAYFDGNRIWLVYKAVRGTNYQICLRYSDDNGATWSNEIQLTYSNVDHEEPSIVGVNTYRGLRIIVFYVYDLGYTMNIYALYSDDYGSTWNWAPIAFSPSLEYAPFALPLSNNSFRLIYSQMVLRTQLSSAAKYKPADIYYMDIRYETPKNGKVLVEWHYQEANGLVLNYSDIIDYSMPVTYTLKYYTDDAELQGWYNRTFENLLNNTTYIPLIQDLFTSQIPSYLSDDTSREIIARTILRFAIAEGASGVGIDIEASLSSAYQSNMTDLFRRIYNYLSVFGVLVFAIIPPKESDSSGWLAYNYTEIARCSDFFVIMAYEYHGSWSDPGPISPTGRVERVIRYALSEISDTNKIILAYPLYGYDWYYNETSGSWVYYRAVFYDDIVSIRNNYPYNESWVYNFTESGTTYEANEYFLEYRGNYYHQVYFVDTESILYRIGLANYYGIDKFSFWRIGLDTDPKLFDLLERWKTYGLQNNITTNTTSPLELFNEKETKISILTILKFPSNMTIMQNQTTISRRNARNGTLVILDTSQLVGEVIELRIELTNRFENLTRTIIIYKLNFEITQIPQVVTRAQILNINSTTGWKSFYLYVSEYNATWISKGEIPKTFELNVTEYTNTTIFIMIAGESVNNNTYYKVYGPIQIINFVKIEAKENTSTIRDVLELFERDTQINITINTTMTANVTILINGSDAIYKILGTFSVIIDTSTFPYGLTNISILVSKDDFAVTRTYLIYKLYIDLTDWPREVLNYSSVEFSISSSQHFLYFNVMYSYDNNTWSLLLNTSNRSFLVNFSIFTDDVYFLIIGFTQYNSYREYYGPIMLLKPICIHMPIALANGSDLELFEKDTTIKINVSVNTSSVMEVTINESLLLHVPLNPKNSTVVMLNTATLAYGIHIIRISIRTTDNKFSFEKTIIIRKLYFDVIVLSDTLYNSTTYKIIHSPGFRYFLVYVIFDNATIFVANTTDTFTLSPSEIGNRTFLISIEAYSAKNNVYTKVYGPYTSIVITKQKKKWVESILLWALIIITAIFTATLIILKRKRRNIPHELLSNDSEYNSNIEAQLAGT